MKKIFKKIYEYVINPPSDDELSAAWQISDPQLPTLWLLGKTGAVKSSIFQLITGRLLLKLAMAACHTLKMPIHATSR